MQPAIRAADWGMGSQGGTKRGGRGYRGNVIARPDGYALVPLSIYFRGPRVKLEVGLAKGKKLYDKRDSAAARDAKREMDRTMKSHRRGGY